MWPLNKIRGLRGKFIQICNLKSIDNVRKSFYDLYSSTFCERMQINNTTNDHHDKRSSQEINLMWKL